MDEFQKIATIAMALGPPSARVHLGIGDDAAVVEAPKGKQLLCSDAMVEGVHFDLSTITPEELGHKAVATCLSDLAAMNGRALYGLISIALPATTGEDFLPAFYLGAGRLARECGLDIVGGDLTSSKSGIFIDVALVGESDHPITRAGARPGDLIAVSGYPGLSAAGLAALQKRERGAVAPSLLQAHLRPMPRFDLLQGLQGLCTSLIDISDGLSSELGHLTERSEVGAEIDALKLPMHLDAINEAGSLDGALHFALSGGEDYELLATFAADKVATLGLPTGFTVIGTVLPADAGVHLVGLDGSRAPLVASGYNHFKPAP